MKICIVNPYVVSNAEAGNKISQYHEQSARLCSSYRKHKPSTPHRFIVVASGGILPDKAVELYDGIANEVIEYSGAGWAEGAFIAAARHATDQDLIVCLISSIRFHRDGWLERLVEAKTHFKTGLFGAMGSFEDSAHIRSCAIACSPSLLAAYPHTVESLESAHAFEHDPVNSFTKFAESLGEPPIQVTWDDFCKKEDWRTPRNIFRRGDQSNCLVWDHHCDAYFEADDSDKKMLESRTDGNQSLRICFDK